jgi:hypothetical protein
VVLFAFGGYQKMMPSGELGGRIYRVSYDQALALRRAQCGCGNSRHRIDDFEAGFGIIGRKYMWSASYSLE